MARSHRLAALAPILALVAGACHEASTGYGSPSTCPADVPCHGTVKGGSGSGSGGGGGEGGAAAQADASGDVALVVSAAFDQTASFTGKATIVAPGASGADVSASYDGATGPFSLTGLASGTTWFFVKDPSGGGSGIFSTFSLQTVPSTSLVLPAVEQTVIAQIASSLPIPTAVSSGRAHLVVFVDRGGQPLAGVSLSGGGFGGTVAYDQGAGFYSNSAKATGSAGVIVILNADASAGQGTATIHVVDANASPYELEVPVAPDAVTLVGMSI